MRIQTIGNWRLLRPLGRATERAITRSYHAQNLRTGNEVALTVVDRAYPANLPVIEDMRSGVGAYRRLGAFDGLVNEVECADLDDHFVVTNGYYPEATVLRALLRRGYAFTERDVLALGCCIGRALAHAHEHGVVFGTIHDGNVLFEPKRGRAHLASLPLQKRESGSLLSIARFLGVPFFHAPEVILGAAPSPRSDVYSLSMILFAACAGAHPFFQSADVGLSCMSVVNAEGLELPADTHVSPQLTQIVHQGLAADADARIPSAAELVERLERIRPRDVAVGPDRHLGDIARRRYPYPIARHLQLLESLDDVAFRLTQVNSAADATLTLLGAIAVSEVRRLGADTSELEGRLRRPSLGHWLETAREASRILLDRRNEITCPELVSVFFTNRGKPAPQAAALNDLLTWRNRRFGHARQSDLEDITLAVEEGERFLRRVVRALAFLSSYGLVQADSMTFEQGRFSTRIARLNGAIVKPDHVELGHPLPCGEVLLTDSACERYTSLEGFLLYRACPECRQQEVFVYQTEERRSRRFLGFHRGHRVEEPVGP